PIGKDEYRFTIEAKSGRHPLRNDEAEVGGALSHRDQVGARFALIVAREFAGFERTGTEQPAILQECSAASGVSIANVETLIALYAVIREFSYPLDAILPILLDVESPRDKLRRIEELRRPTDQFDFRGVLDAIWTMQQKEAAGDIVSYRAIWQSRPDRWGIP